MLDHGQSRNENLLHQATFTVIIRHGPHQLQLAHLGEAPIAEMEAGEDDILLVHAGEILIMLVVLPAQKGVPAQRDGRELVPFPPPGAARVQRHRGAAHEDVDARGHAVERGRAERDARGGGFDVEMRFSDVRLGVVELRRVVVVENAHAAHFPACRVEVKRASRSLEMVRLRWIWGRTCLLNRVRIGSVGLRIPCIVGIGWWRWWLGCWSIAHSISWYCRCA